MAREKVARVTCDRCKKLIEETPADAAGKDEDDGQPVLVIEASGVCARPAIKLRDVCQPCIDRISNLLGQIALEKPAETSEKDAKDNKSDTPAPPAPGDASTKGNGADKKDDKPSAKSGKARGKGKGSSASTPPS